MEPAITSRYNDNILAEALKRYQITNDQLKVLDAFESYIYEFEKDGEPFILCIGHSIRRSIELIQGEVDWINYLAEGGAGVARAVLSAKGNLVEAIDDGQGGQFLATAFVKAPGVPAWQTQAGWTPTLYETYGRLIGRIHALSKTYNVSNPAWKRGDWDSPENLDVTRWIPESDTIVREKYQQVKAHLDTLPRDKESYGMIHQDAHAGNFFVTEEGDITLFDFDDCVHGWYIYDVAMVVFYMLTLHKDPVQLMTEFWPKFWAGYQQENTLDPSWLPEIHTFMKLREIDLYGVIHRSYDDVENIEHPWTAAFMKGRKARIENDTPIIDFNFA